MEPFQNNIELMIKFVENKLDNKTKREIELALLDDPVQMQIMRGMFLLKKNYPNKYLDRFLDDKQKHIEKRVLQKSINSIKKK